MKYLFYALRPSHWIKNFFIFIPLIFSKKLFLFPLNAHTLLAFLVFCMTTSGVYLINDIIDIQKDKKHPIKRLRPLAAGKLSVSTAGRMAMVLLAASLISAFALNVLFGFVVAIYLVANLMYSYYLKHIIVIDVFCLAFFFLLRIIAGSIICQSELSHWIIFMIVLLALFLGLNKRRQELRLSAQKKGMVQVKTSQYSLYLIDQMTAVVTASIVVVYMLYSVDARTFREMGSNHLMYSIPFVYYGIFRYFFLIHKLHHYGDPTHLLLSDSNMRINILLWISTCLAVIYFGL